MEDKIKENIKIINKNELDDEVLDYSIAEVLDRVRLYLNVEEIPINLERVLTSVVNNLLKKYTAADDKFISSISDNGQSVTYSKEQFFTAISDEDMFLGFTSILSRYRRIKVVHPRNNEK